MLKKLLPFLFTSTPITGNFFPENYKTTKLKEGDVLISKREDGYSINKVIKVDKILFKKGNKVLIQKQEFTVTESDFMLIISMSYGKGGIKTKDEAIKVAKSGKWEILYGHIPNRVPGSEEGQEFVCNIKITKDELEGYKIWKAAFDKGEAGVF